MGPDPIYRSKPRQTRRNNAARLRKKPRTERAAGWGTKNFQETFRIWLTPSASRLKRRSTTPAQVAELVDALASGASVRMDVEVRVLSWAPFIQRLYNKNKWMRIFFFA